jgi:hypothetical protein
MLVLIENCSDNLDQNTISQTHSNSNLVQINREKKFSLNLEKTLEKKILATKREVQFEYHQTGGGIVGNADAITYEHVFGKWYSDQDCHYSFLSTPAFVSDFHC